MALALLASPAAADTLHDCYQTADAQLEVTACETLLAAGGLDAAKLAHVHTGHGVGLANLGRIDEAIAEHTQALALVPDFAIALGNRASAWNAKGDFAAAIADLDQAIRLDTNRSGFYNSRAWALYKLGEFDKALVDAEGALKLSPGKPGILDTRAHIFEALGQRDRAIADYRKVLAADPGAAEAAAGLVRLGAGP